MEEHLQAGANMEREEEVISGIEDAASFIQTFFFAGSFRLSESSRVYQQHGFSCSKSLLGVHQEFDGLQE